MNPIHTLAGRLSNSHAILRGKKKQHRCTHKDTHTAPERSPARARRDARLRILQFGFAEPVWRKIFALQAPVTTFIYYLRRFTSQRTHVDCTSNANTIILR